MLALSATDVAIRVANENGTLEIRDEKVNPKYADLFDSNIYTGIFDEHGIIEVHLTREDAMDRIYNLLRKV